MDSAIGLSTMLAIGPDGFARMLERLPCDGRALPHGAARREPAGADGAAHGLVHRLLRRADRRRAALRPVPGAVPRLPPAADDGVERQERPDRLGVGRRRHRAGLLGRARHERAAQLLPADPPGHAADPVRPHLLRFEPQPARAPPRSARRERLRAGRGACVRKDRGGGRGRGNAGVARAAPHLRRQPADQRDHGGSPHARGARCARRALRAQRVHAGRRLVDQLVRSVGRRARQAAGAAHRARARGDRRARADPRLLDERADPALPAAARR